MLFCLCLCRCWKLGFTRANTDRCFSCLSQMTFQACSIDEARHLYDQLAVLTPIMVSFTLSIVVANITSTYTNSCFSTLMQLLLSFDQDMRVEKTLIQTLTCQFVSTLMQLLFPFDQNMRVEKTLIQTLACQLSSTLMQLLFSFDQDMRVEKTLIQTLAYQLSSTLINSCFRLTRT